MDRLLRGAVLVDLYRVVRQGIRASVESYSIKRLEPLYGLTARSTSRTRGAASSQFETWLELGADRRTGTSATDPARDRGLQPRRRREQLAPPRLAGGPAARPRGAAGHGDPAPAPAARGRRAGRARGARGRGRRGGGGADARPRGRRPRGPDDDRRAAGAWLLAQLLAWHRREDKAFWWRYFELLRHDRRRPRRGARADRHGRARRRPRPGQPRTAPASSASASRPRTTASKVGRAGRRPARPRRRPATVAEVDDAGRHRHAQPDRSELARGTPASLIPNDVRADDASSRTPCCGSAEWVAEEGIAGAAAPDAPDRVPRRARAPPAAPPRGSPGGARRARSVRAGESAARRRRPPRPRPRRRARSPIQGPPGTGKTYTGARMILALVAAGKTVGVTANSHKVIGNVLDAVVAAAQETGARTAAGAPHRHRPEAGKNEEPAVRRRRAARRRARHRGGAADGHARRRRRHGLALVRGRDGGGAVDVLLVDEAGQFSLANAVAVSPAGRSLVLLGDPQQLDQPLKGSHPPGAERSALAHLLAGAPGEPPHATMPPERGLFIEKTWRLHPDDLRLHVRALLRVRSCARSTGSSARRSRRRASAPRPTPGAARRRQRHPLAARRARRQRHRLGRGGRRRSSTLVRDLLDGGARGRTATGVEAPLRLEDIVIVAPVQRPRRPDRRDARGRRASRARASGPSTSSRARRRRSRIYAMGTSSPEDAPRGMEFLYSLNRLNVATSRARCVALVVASPALVRVACRRPARCSWPTRSAGSSRWRRRVGPRRRGETSRVEAGNAMCYRVLHGWIERTDDRRDRRPRTRPAASTARAPTPRPPAWASVSCARTCPSTCGGSRPARRSR